MSLASYHSIPCSQRQHSSCAIISTILNALNEADAQKYLNRQIDNVGVNALMISAGSGESCQLSALLKYGSSIRLREMKRMMILFVGAAVNSVDSRRGYTALHYAAMHHQLHNVMNHLSFSYLCRHK